MSQMTNCISDPLDDGIITVQMAFRLRLEPPYLKDQCVRYSNGLHTWSRNAIEIPEAKPHDRLSIAVGRSSHQHSSFFLLKVLMKNDVGMSRDVPGA